MSIQGAMNNSSLAMQAQSIAMHQISTNVANVRTVGYKHDIVNFRTLVSGTSSGLFRSFSTQPASCRAVEQQGSIHVTGMRTDVAINGRGMFMVSRTPAGDGDTYYTRDGAFGRSVVKEDGKEVAYLTTGAGYYVQGWRADLSKTPLFDSSKAPEAIRFDPNGRIDGKQTTGLTLVGNVNAESSNGVVRADFSYIGTPVTGADGTESWPVRGVRLVFQKSIPDPEATQKARDEAIKAAEEARGSALTDEEIQAINEGISLRKDAGQNAWFIDLQDADGKSVGTFTGMGDTPMVKFDSRGRLVEPAGGALNVDITYTKAVLDENGKPVMDANGNPVTEEAAAPQSLAINISDVTQYGESHSGFGSSFTVSAGDGYPEGDLIMVGFDSEGTLLASYTNNRTLPLYKLALADFPALQQLQLLSENLFMATDQAGERMLMELGTESGGRTSINPEALEASTADIGEEFSRMIMTQTAYSQAATVFRTSDEMSQVASALKR